MMLLLFLLAEAWVSLLWSKSSLLTGTVMRCWHWWWEENQGGSQSHFNSLKPSSYLKFQNVPHRRLGMISISVDLLNNCNELGPTLNSRTLVSQLDWIAFYYWRVDRYVSSSSWSLMDEDLLQYQLIILALVEMSPMQAEVLNVSHSALVLVPLILYRHNLIACVLKINSEESFLLSS